MKAARKAGRKVEFRQNGDFHFAEGSGLNFFLSLIGDGEGRTSFHNPIWRALCSYFGNRGPRADLEEIVSLIRATVMAAPKSAGRDQNAIDRYLSAEYLMDQAERARAFIADQQDEEEDEASSNEDADEQEAPADEEAQSEQKEGIGNQAADDQAFSDITLEADGSLRFAKTSSFTAGTINGRNWFGTRDGKGFDPICQAFRIKNVAADANGGTATLTVEFDTLHNGTQEVTFSRAELYERNELPKRFSDKWFSIREPSGFTDLLNELEFPVDTMIVERTGWHCDAFLHPNGMTIGTPVPAIGVRRAKLRLRNGTAAGNWRGGTLDGWKQAVAPAFANGAVDREQFALEPPWLPLGYKPLPRSAVPA